MKYQLKTRLVSFLADTITPVSAYLRVRDRYANTFLLESSDYHGEEDSFSYIACDPISDFEVLNGQIKRRLPGADFEVIDQIEPEKALSDFRSLFDYQSKQTKHIVKPVSLFIDIEYIVSK